MHRRGLKLSTDLKTSMTERTIFYVYTIILLKSVCLSVDVSKLQVTILARSARRID